MKIIKPNSLTLLHRTFESEKGLQLCISPIVCFSLGESPELIPEQLAWDQIGAALKKKAIFDLGLPKRKAEVLMTGVVLANQDQPRSKQEVRLDIGSHFSKSIYAFGAQLATYTKGEWQYSKPSLLEELVLDWGNSYGGPEHSTNPIGKDWPKLEANPQEDQVIELPSFRYTDDAYQALDQQSPSAGFSSLPIGSPAFQLIPKSKEEADKYATYVSSHQNIVQLAPRDQQLSVCFSGDESYKVIGLNADKTPLNGRLPSFRLRAFVQRRHQSSSEIEELDLKLDTLWLFTDQGAGALVARGSTQIEDVDAHDIASIMIAYENLNDQPKSTAHYRKVHQLRVDPATAMAHALHDSQLSPAKTKAQLEQETLEELKLKNRREKNQTLLRKDIDQSIQELFENQTLDFSEQLDAEPSNQDVSVAEVPLITPESIDRGDVDLSEVLAIADKQIAECRGELDRKIGELSQEIGSSIDDLAQDQEKEIRFADQHKELQARFVELQGDDYLSLAQKKGLEEAQILLRQVAQEDTTDAHFFDQESRDYLRGRVKGLLAQGESLAGLDLSGANLCDIDFSGQNLQSTLLESADLSGCDFTNANLSGAVLTGANIDGARFDNANFDRANLSQLAADDVLFTHVNFAQVRMIQSNFSNCDFSKCTLSETLLVDVSFETCDFSNISLNSGQWLRVDCRANGFKNSTLNRCSFVECDLNSSDLSFSRLNTCLFVQCNLQKVAFSSSHLNKIQFAEGCDLKHSRFDQSTAHTVGFLGLDLECVNFSSIAFVAANFSNCTIAQSNFNAANLMQGLFAETDLSDIDARHLNLLEANLRKSRWQNADLRHSQFTSLNLEYAQFIDCDTSASQHFSGQELAA